MSDRTLAWLDRWSRVLMAAVFASIFIQCVVHLLLWPFGGWKPWTHVGAFALSLPFTVWWASTRIPPDQLHRDGRS